MVISGSNAPSTIEEEIDYRLELWAQLNSEYQANLPSAVLKEMQLYRGQRGIYADSVRTKPLTGDTAIAVSLLHTGTSYPDDLSEDGVLYHYPHTQQPARDDAEVSATKAASVLGVPVFTIAPGEHGLKRVHLSWVEGWDDEAELFLVSFGEEAPTPPARQEDPDEFDLFAELNRSKREVTVRPGQQRFKFLVFQRYGSKCAVCSMEIPELLQAAHLVPVSQKGSFDPRNGLVLCYTHHRALDVGLFAFDPETTTLAYKDGGPDAGALGIQVDSLAHLGNKPHDEALAWCWERWAS